MNLFATQFSFQTMSFEIYLSGCKLHPCKGCFDQETWDENAGTKLNGDKYAVLEKRIVNKINLIDNIWVLGGEPLEKPLNELLTLFNFLKRFNKPIWLFTRYSLKDIPEQIKDYVDYIKTGMYNKDMTNKTKTRFGITLGSYNQEIYKKENGNWVIE